MKTLICALAVSLAACGSDEESELTFPPVETRYTAGATLECRGTVDETWTPASGPVSGATTYTCTWERVTISGAPTCAAVLVFARHDTASPWVLSATFATSATHCT